MLAPEFESHGRDCGLTILVLGAGRGWHAGRLEAAFAAHGVTPVHADLTTCAFDTGAPAGLAIPGLDRLPDGVFVRMVPGGSFEQVTLLLGILHALAAAGVTVWNAPAAIERSVDKSTTTHLMRAAGLPVPRTWAGLSPDKAEALASQASAARPLVQKPLFGAQGRGIRLVTGPHDLAQPEEFKGAYYLQEDIAPPPDGPRDWRVFVCGGRVVASMQRHGTGWITNVFQGARGVKAALPPDLARLGVLASRAIGTDYAGVDIIEDADRGPMVLEVNSMPAWAALERTTGVEVATEVVAAFLAATHAALERKAAPA